MSAPSDKDSATEIGELVALAARVTQALQKLDARLERLSGPEAEHAAHTLRLLQEVTQLLEKPLAILAHPDVVNAIKGLETSGKRQRSGFEALAAQIRDVPFKDVMPLLALLPRAKCDPGRRKGSEILSDADVLKRMKADVEGGMSIPRAARKFANEARAGGTEESAAKRLERKYRSGEK
jgi:hypothetical protein